MDSAKIERLKSAGIDYEAGVERFGGNAEMFEKFIRRFSDDTHFQELLESMEKQDCDNAYRIAHSLKGVVGNLSFGSYYETVVPFVEFLRANKFEEASLILPQIVRVHTQVTEALKEV